jgi:hypothetical protein
MPARFDSGGTRGRGALSAAALERQMNQRPRAGDYRARTEVMSGTPRQMVRSSGQLECWQNMLAEQSGGADVSDIKSDEKVVVERSSINVANIIAAIALLILVIGLLRYIGVKLF